MPHIDTAHTPNIGDAIPQPNSTKTYKSSVNTSPKSHPAGSKTHLTTSTQIISPPLLSPNHLLPHRRTRINHPSIPHKDPNMRHIANIAILLAPEEHIALFRFSPRNVLCHAGSSAVRGIVSAMAVQNGVLCETWTEAGV